MLFFTKKKEDFKILNFFIVQVTSQSDDKWKYKDFRRWVK